MFKTSYNYSSHQEFVLFNNKDILLDGYSVFHKNCFEKGFFLIQGLLDIDGNVMSYTKFTEKYLLIRNSPLQKRERTGTSFLY